MHAPVVVLKLLLVLSQEKAEREAEQSAHISETTPQLVSDVVHAPLFGS